MSHFQIEIILWSRLDIPVNNKNDNKEHSKLLFPYVYMIVLLVSAHACMRKCIPHAQSCLNYLYNIHILYLSLSMTMKLWFW